MSNASPASRLPFSLWNAFDDSASADFDHISGPPPSVQTGELTGPGSSTVHFTLAKPAARVECALYTQRFDSRSGLLVRVVDDRRHYRVQINLAEAAFELHQVNGDDSRVIAATPIPLPPDVDDFHAAISVEDTGDDLACQLLDLGLSIRASDGGTFDNLFTDAARIGLYGIGDDGSRFRVLRAWSDAPVWNGREHVEPMFGAQHIWTKVQTRHVGRHDRTYWGWSTIWGGVQLRWYDHTEKRFGPIETIYRYPGNVRWAYDDHHPPGIYVHSDGHVWVWIQSHKTVDPFVLLRSQHPEDLADWRPPVDMNTYPDAPQGGVYPNGFRISNGEARMIHRTGGSGDGQWYIRRSRDNGETWDCRKIIDNSEGHVYQFIRQNPNNPDHLMLVGNHKDVTTRPNSWRRIYAWESTDGGETFQTVTDKRPISIPAKRTDLEPVYTDATHQLFVTGHAIRPDGTPLILAAHRDDPDHELVSLSWQNGRWQMSEITPSDNWPGAGSYKEQVWRPSGGDVNPRNTDEITLSVAVNGTHEIQRWQTPDQGLTWAKTADVTSNSVVKNFRPIYVQNAHPEDWRLLWHAGEFYGTTETPSTGRHFDRFDDVMIVNELLCGTGKAAHR